MRFTRRDFLRTYGEAPIHYRNAGNDERFDATMCNCSRTGMQFVSSRYLQPGSAIIISLKPKGKRTRPGGSCRRREAVVRWCHAEESGHFFTGVQFSETPES